MNDEQLNEVWRAIKAINEVLYEITGHHIDKFIPDYYRRNNEKTSNSNNQNND